MNPKISIIVPVYKVEPYLRKCIDSILNQTFKDFELILVDDGSPDNCGKICDEYAEKDERIIVIHNENMGVSSARNCGIDKARGKYIAFIDPDDEIESNMYEELIELSEKNGLDISLCKIKTSDIKLGDIYTSEIFKKDILNKCEIKNELIPSILNGKSFSIYSSVNKLYRSNLFKKSKLRFDCKLTHGEDARLNMRLLTMINSIGFINKPLYNYYRYDRESLTQIVRDDFYYNIKDNFIFGLNMCKKYGVKDAINKIERDYINNTLNYILDVSKKNDNKYKIINDILDDSIFCEILERYEAPSFYYNILKKNCLNNNIKLIVVLEKIKNTIKRCI